MKVLIVAPGPLHSTFDVYKYYREAIEKVNDVQTISFSFHNIIRWQHDAAAYFIPSLDEGSLNQVAVSRAARELLVDIVTFNPDVIFTVSGLMIPTSVWREVLLLRERMIKKFAIAFYFTESPYMDEKQHYLASYADIIFVNDKYSVNVFDPDDSKMVYYLPHSYNPRIHHTNTEYGYDLDFYKSDVFFCGTPFYERGKLLSEANWDGINLKLGGNWQHAAAEEHFSVLKDYCLMDITMPNEYLARYYRGTKIALNIHRTREYLEGSDTEIDKDSAYSIGPRIYEAVACGAFILTDWRQEAYDIFGDSIEYFNSSQELESKTRYWLDPKNEAMRMSKAHEAKERLGEATFSDRFDKIVLPVFKQVVERYLT